ncbi:hypothetical protein [Enterovirga rhinocerotis]|uniref:hypothetical protein n=1 Tax=Enterovirga rhinocerotis TaxID=1339210 RepID=UPI00105E5A91|nr:hypothetical protein [Enterovirga rhinocerotis]
MSDIAVPGVVAPDHGARVLVDGSIEGNVLLATAQWVLVQPTTSVVPMAVSPGRVAFADH